MGYDLVLGILYVLLAPFVFGGFVLVYVHGHRKRRALEEVWRAQAERRGRGFVASSGQWPERTSPRVEWTEAGLAFRLEMVSLGRVVHTRLLVVPDGTFAGRVYVGPEGAGPPGLEPVGSATNDRRFSSVFAARARPVALGEALLDADVRNALVTFRQGAAVSLRYRKGQLVLLWPGVETNEARVDEAVRLLVASAARLTRTFRHAA